jgi:proteasome assembly chaperone (PAC2) family protein
MTELVEIHGRPDLDAPAFLIALDGWVDAGGAMARTRRLILDSSTPRPVATFDTDLLINFRSRRPAVRLVDGVAERVSWPQIELVSMTDGEGRDLLVLHGLEPDHQWHNFTEAVVELIVGFGSRIVVSLGGYPAATPHTRPVKVTAAATDQSMLAGVGHAAGAVNAPAGIQTVIEQAAAAAGIDGLGIYAQVPHYAVKGPYPAASRALLETLWPVAGLRFDPAALTAEEEQARRRLDKAIARSNDNRQLVEKLEKHHDRLLAGSTAELPSGEELAAQLEEFLRDQDGDE